MINRRITRVLLNSTEITGFLNKPNSTNYVTALQTTDALYLGLHGRFACRYFQVGVANAVVSTLTVEQWDGSAWVAVDDLVDQTSVGGATLAQSGFISWVNKSTWVQSTQTGVDADVSLYWVRIKVSANLTGTTALKSILNVYSDDQLLAAYFPELVSDANYLPSGKTNFLDQHVAAKDLVVLRLKQRKMIDDESQIIDPNDVAIASVYAAAKLILQPIATSEDSKTLLVMAAGGFDAEIGKVSFSVDQDGDGIVSELETVQSFSVEVTRR